MFIYFRGGAFFEGINIGLIYPLIEFSQKGDQFLGNHILIGPKYS
jgi:hypothetical protein